MANSHVKRSSTSLITREIEALCTIAKTWKQPRYPSTDDWLKIMFLYIYIYIYVCIYVYVYMHAIEYYSAIKK